MMMKMVMEEVVVGIVQSLPTTPYTWSQSAVTSILPIATLHPLK